MSHCTFPASAICGCSPASSRSSIGLIVFAEPGASRTKLPPTRSQAHRNSCPLMGAIRKHGIPRIRIRSASNCRVKVFPAPLVPSRQRLALGFLRSSNRFRAKSVFVSRRKPSGIPSVSGSRKPINGYAEDAPSQSTFRSAFRRTDASGITLGETQLHACS